MSLRVIELLLGLLDNWITGIAFCRNGLHELFECIFHCVKRGDCICELYLTFWISFISIIEFNNCIINHSLITVNVFIRTHVLFYLFIDLLIMCLTFPLIVISCLGFRTWDIY